MARAKRKHFKRKMTLPLAVVGGFAPLAVNTMRTPGGIDRKLWMFTQATTGFDTDTGKWWAPNLNKGTTWILVGTGIHMLANRFGINRAIARSGIPLVRI